MTYIYKRNKNLKKGLKVLSIYENSAVFILKKN